MWILVKQEVHTWNPLIPDSFPSSMHLCTVSTCHVRGHCSPSVHFSGARLVGQASTHGEPPLAILLMMFMTSLEPSNWGSRWWFHWSWFSCMTPWTWTGSDQWHITHHPCTCFLEGLSAKCLSGVIGVVSGCTPFHWGAHWNPTKFLSLQPKLVPSVVMRRPTSV